MNALQVIDEELGEMTPNGIPVSLRPFFQEYTLENLAPQTDSFTIIERTLSRGSRRELRLPHWEDVKTFFRAETKRLSELWFLPPDK